MSPEAFNQQNGLPTTFEGIAANPDFNSELRPFVDGLLEQARVPERESQLPLVQDNLSAIDRDANNVIQNLGLQDKGLVEQFGVVGDALADRASHTHDLKDTTEAVLFSVLEPKQLSPKPIEQLVDLGNTEGVEEAIHSLAASGARELATEAAIEVDAAETVLKLKSEKSARSVEGKLFRTEWADIQDLSNFQIKMEQHAAEAAVLNVLKTGEDAVQRVSVVQQAIELKKASQAYLREHTSYELVTSREQENQDIVQLIAPALSQIEARKLYRDATTELTDVTNHALSEIVVNGGWSMNAVCAVLDTMGVDNSQDLLKAALENSALSALAEKLRGVEGWERVTNLQLEYYRRRVEKNNTLEHDSGVAAEMIMEMGVDDPSLASKIAISASGNAHGGLKQVGLDPSLAITSIAEKIDSFGVEGIMRLNESMGITSFHRYDVGHLQFLLQVVNKDPSTLEELRGEKTLVTVLDGTDDYNGGLQGAIDAARDAKGKSLVFEVGSKDGETLDEQFGRVAEFIDENRILVRTLVLGAHGNPDSGGLRMGGRLLKVSSDERSERIDSPGMRSLLDRLDSGSDIIVYACSQGALNPGSGQSSAGELARVAHDVGVEDVSAFGLNQKGNLVGDVNEGGFWSVQPGSIVRARIDPSSGNVVHENLGSTHDGFSPTIPVPALQGVV